MKTKLLFLLLFVTAVASAQQQLLPINAYGYQWHRGKFLQFLEIPQDTTQTAPNGSLAMKTGVLYIKHQDVWVLASTGAPVPNIPWENVQGNITNNPALRDSLNARQRALPLGTVRQFITGTHTLGNLDSLASRIIQDSLKLAGPLVMKNGVVTLPRASDTSDGYVSKEDFNKVTLVGNLQYEQGVRLLGNKVQATFQTPMWNANRLQGYLIEPGQPADSAILRYDKNAGMWRIDSISLQGGGAGASDGNNFATSIAFNSLTGNVTLQRNGLADLTMALDGRYNRYNDTANMLSPYLRKSDTAAMLSPYVRKATTITINGQAFDLSQNRSWTIPGTVYTAGAGISIAGNVITNTARDTAQVLSLNGNTLELSRGGGSVTLPSLSLVAGTGIAISGNTISSTIVDTDTDDQTLSIAGNNLSIQGGNTVTLPIVTYTAGTGISITNGVISTTAQGGDPSSTNEIQTLSLSGQTLSLSLGGGSVTLPDAPTYTAGNGISISGNVISATNATQSLSLLGNTLSLSGSNSVTLPIIDYSGGTGISISGGVISSTVVDTDDQTLSIAGNTLSIQGGNSITLPLSNYTAGTGINISSGGVISSTVINTDGQQLSISGNTLSITGGNSIVLPTPTDENNYVSSLSYSAGVLTLSRHNMSNLTANIPIPSYTAGAGISVSGNTITNTSLNTDNQNLSLVGNVLSISGGNSVTLPTGSGGEPDGNNYPTSLDLTGSTLILSRNNMPALSVALPQAITYQGGTGISIAGNVISSTVVNTDAQQLTLAGNVLSITGGNSVTLPNLSGNGAPASLAFIVGAPGAPVGGQTTFTLPEGSESWQVALYRGKLRESTIPDASNVYYSKAIGSRTLTLHGDTWHTGESVIIEFYRTTDAIAQISDLNNYPTSLAFNTTTGVLTMGRNGLANLTADLDGRYQLLSDVVTASNGLTKTGNNIKLGGNLTENTNLSFAPYSLYMYGGSFQYEAAGIDNSTTYQSNGMGTFEVLSWDESTDKTAWFNIYNTEETNATSWQMGSYGIRMQDDADADGLFIEGIPNAATSYNLYYDPATKKVSYGAAASGGAADGNNFPSSLAFNTATGVLTMGRDGLTDLTVDLDNRYLTSFTEVDGSTTNEIQTLSWNSGTRVLSISAGNSVTLPAYLTAEVDGSTTNEIQTISRSGTTVTLSNSGGTFTVPVLSATNGLTLTGSAVELGGQLTKNVYIGADNYNVSIGNANLFHITAHNGAGMEGNIFADSTTAQLQVFNANGSATIYTDQGELTNPLATVQVMDQDSIGQRIVVGETSITFEQRDFSQGGVNTTDLLVYMKDLPAATAGHTHVMKVDPGTGELALATDAGGSGPATADSLSVRAKMVRGLGASIVAEPLWSFYESALTVGLTDGRTVYIPVYLEQDETIGGVTFQVTTAGDYTADGFNGFTLYSFDGTTLTKVAQTANNGNVWKTAGVRTEAFSSPYAATKGVYYIAATWNASATTTGPVVLTSDNLRANVQDFMTGGFLSGYNTLDQTTTTTTSRAGVTIANQTFYFALYKQTSMP